MKSLQFFSHIFFYSKIKSNLSEISRVKLEHLVHVSLVSFIPFTPKTSTLKSSFKFRLMAADFCGCASGSRVLQSHSHSQKVLQSHSHSHFLAVGVDLEPLAQPQKSAVISLNLKEDLRVEVFGVFLAHSLSDLDLFGCKLPFPLVHELSKQPAQPRQTN